MALESLFDTPPPLVSKGNNDTDKPANNSVSEEIMEEVSNSTKDREGAGGDAPNEEELEDGEINEDSVEEKEDDEDASTDDDDLEPEERKRRKKRLKNKERRKRKKEEKRMQALQAWAMAMAAGEMGEQDDNEDDDIASEEETPPPTQKKPVPLMSKTLDEIPMKLQYSPKKKKSHKRPRVPSPLSDSEDEGEYAKLLRKEMSRHKLKRKSSGESSSDDRRNRSPVMYESDGPRRQDDGNHSEEDDNYDNSSHRSKRKRHKKHKRHHHSKRSKSKSRRNTMASDEDDEDTAVEMSASSQQLHQSMQQQQEQYEQQQREQELFEQQQQEMSEQDHQIMMDQEMGKRHIPKTHLICKFYLENKCKKGLDCSYTHDGSIPKRLEQCKFYLQGFCSKGPLCMFLHQEYPCKYFHTGQVCYSGEKCRFSHKPLTEDLKHLVEMFRSEQAHVRENEQPPLLPSPEKHANVPFQRGNQGGKPPKVSTQGGVAGGSGGGIPSLFDLNVKPVGEKGQMILETERLEAQDIKFERISFFGAEEEEPHKHSRPPPMLPQLLVQPEHKNTSDGSMQRQILSPGRTVDKSNHAVMSQEPPLLPTPLPLIPEIPVEFQPPHPSTLLPLTLIPPQQSEGTTETGKDVAQDAESSHTFSEPTHAKSSQAEGGVKPTPASATPEVGNNTVINHNPVSTSENEAPSLEYSSSANDATGMGVTTTSESEDPTADGINKTADAIDKKVVKPPVSMPAKSKALFLRIQQNQARTDAASNADGDTPGKEMEAAADDNWYSSDEEDATRKKRSAPNTALNVHINKTATMPEPSAVSPEASNKGPLLSSVLMANNKQTEAHLAQSQLPGPLASLFSPSNATAATMVKPPPLPLNILDLVTKGTSSVQKSTNPQVQDLFAGILPRKEVNNGYRLLQCIRDPNLTDPREGRERKSKAGMLFRILKWKGSEYSVADIGERPSLPPIELTTPTEMKAQPVFPTSDPRTQAVVDALKKVIDEARAKPSDPRNQRLVDPRTQQQQDHRAFPPPTFVPGQPPPAAPRIGPMPLFPTNQLPPPVPGQTRGPGPGFMRIPMGQPSQSFPPHMPRPPQGVPTGYATPRYASRGPRGPRPMRQEFGQRMQHRPPRQHLRPPFGSPLRQGPPPQERMSTPRDPRFVNMRLASPEAVISGENQVESRDPRATNRGPAALDPRLLKRNSILSTTPPSDVDMRLTKDPRLAKKQEQTATSAGFSVAPPVQRFPKQGVGDIDMRHAAAAKNVLGQPRPLAPAVDGFSTYSENTSGQVRGRLDPRQAARAPDIAKDIDLRQRQTVPVQPGETESDIPLKDMFKGRDPTASPFL